ncbi:hypothetical protein ACKKBG_A23610 [Auxenochlorella protothecoides x Auxenochlorella symbiontica]
MDGEDAIDTFMALTNAPRHVAQHVLDAHAGDLEAGVSFYLEGGGVGHGVTGPSGSLDPVLYTAALSAQEQPRSSPLTAFGSDEWDMIPASPRGPEESGALHGEGEEEEVEEEDDELQVLSSNLPHTRAATSARAQAAGGAPARVPSPDEGRRRLRRNRPGRAAAAASWAPEAGSTEEEGEGPRAEPAPHASLAAGARRRRAARQAARASLLAQALVDPDLDDEDEPGFAGPVSGWDGAGEALGDDGEWPARPPAGPATLAAAAGLPDVDLEEQRMLLAAYAGEAYEPPPAPGPSAAGPLSPRAQERAVLRSEQDAAFHASLQADRAKAEAARGAAERAAREAREAAEAAEERAALEREAREARERDLDERAARLPAEPAAERPDAVRLLVRLPGGARLTRRFGAEDAVPAVFAWVDVSCRDDPAAPTPGSYRLVAQFPRRVLLHDSQESLGSAGFNGGQEMLLLESTT